MKVALTGANRVHRISRTDGTEEHGHEVTALVRDDAQAGSGRSPRRHPGRG